MPYESSWAPIDDLVKAARKAVERWEKGDLAEAVRELDAALKELDSTAASESQVSAAMDIHESDARSIDQPGALVSVGEDGYWVSGSFFVPCDPEEDPPEEE